MSAKTQEYKMRKLADLLGHDLSYIYGERENGPNGDKKAFLNTGKAFLRALARDLGFSECRVSANNGGIAMPGDCTLVGVWENSGLYIDISQFHFGPEYAVVCRTLHSIDDYFGGSDRHITRQQLASMTYSQFIDRATGGKFHERVA